jgi:hypothetical protein
MKISIKPDGNMEIVDGNFSAVVSHHWFPTVVAEIFDNTEADKLEDWLGDYDYIPYRKYLDMKYERDSWEEKYNELSKAYEDVEKERDEWECRYKDLT